MHIFFFLNERSAALTATRREIAKLLAAQKQDGARIKVEVCDFGGLGHLEILDSGIWILNLGCSQFCGHRSRNLFSTLRIGAHPHKCAYPLAYHQGVIHEQNFLLSFETLSLFCELLVVRMGMIDEAKTECPVDVLVRGFLLLLQRNTHIFAWDFATVFAHRGHMLIFFRFSGRRISTALFSLQHQP